MKDHYELRVVYPNGTTDKVFMTLNQSRAEAEYSSYDDQGVPSGSKAVLVHVTEDDEITLKTRTAGHNV